jgi:hypothetical protein
MTDDTTPEGGPSQQPDEIGPPPWNPRTELYVAGAMSNRYMNLQHLTQAWMEELIRVGFSLGGRREASEVTYPPEYGSEGNALPVRLDNGQTLVLRLNAFQDDPRGDGRFFMRTEVQGVSPKTDRAQLAALAVLEGAELRKNLKLRDEDLDRIRRQLREDKDFSTNVESKMVAFVRLLLWTYRPNLDQKTDEGIKMFVEVYDRVAKVAEATRQLSDFLEFGDPVKDNRQAANDAQTDIYAAELRHFAGMNNRDIAEAMRLDLSPEKERSAKQVASNRADRGEQYYIQAMGQQRWNSYKREQRRLYRHSI